MSSLLPLQISEEESKSVLKRKKYSYKHVVVIGLTTLLLVNIFYVWKFFYQKEEVIQEYGLSLTEDWYYDRESMNLTECLSPSGGVPRKIVAVGQVNASCADVEACILLLRPIASQANFYIMTGRAFEGLGWTCNITEAVSIKFSNVPHSHDDILFYSLLKIGTERGEVISHPEIRHYDLGLRHIYRK